MNVYQLHVDKFVLTLLVVTSAPVTKVTYWVVMKVLALVCNSYRGIYIKSQIDLAMLITIHQN